MRRFLFNLLPLLALALLFVVAGIYRPLLPVDETRYMTVAWEMWQHGGWLKPLTLNGEPYHHKPPMLFWLINLSWGLLGVHRWAGLMPPLLACLGNLWLVGVLGRQIFADRPFCAAKTRLMMVGSLPVLMYGTLVMFDMLLSACVLTTLVFLLRYVQHRKGRDILGIGLGIGLGLLVKGPVILLHVLPVMLAAPLWWSGLMRRGRYYGGCVLAVLMGAMMILGWLVPVLSSTDNQFAFWLLWNQTAGRVTGNFSDAHVHPFYFYLPLLPILFLPWLGLGLGLGLPDVWRRLRQIPKQKQQIKAIWQQDWGLRFLLCWLVPVFVGFSLIKGKQPHYLVPMVPGIMLLLHMLAPEITKRRVIALTTVMVLLVAGGQIGLSAPFLSRYDLRPIARMMAAEPKHEWAFTPNYHGELGFLGRVTHPMAEPNRAELPSWLAKDPNRRAVVRFKTDEDIKGLHPIMSMPYRSGRIGVFMAPPQSQPAGEIPLDPPVQSTL